MGHFLSWDIPEGGAIYINVSSYVDDINEKKIPNRINVKNERRHHKESHMVSLRPGTEYYIALVADNTAGRAGRWVTFQRFTFQPGMSLTFSANDLEHVGDP